MKLNYKKYGTGALIIALTILSLLYMVASKNEEYEIIASPVIMEEQEKTDKQEIEIEPEESPQLAQEQVVDKVPIHVCGQVKYPDVYYLEETALVKEAIITAGGFTDEADPHAWNLAMQIQSGLKIYVPKMGEQIDKSINSYDNRVGGIKLPEIEGQLININVASAGELEALPGIGPTISQNIIAYRNVNGDFKSFQDVMNVPRIGQATLEKIKDSICFQ